MPDFGETPELAESGSPSQNPGIVRIDPPPAGEGVRPRNWGVSGGGPRNPGNRGIRRNSGSSWKWLIRGVRPPELAQTRGSDPQKRPKPTPKAPKRPHFGPNRPQKRRIRGSQTSDFGPKGGYPQKRKKVPISCCLAPLKGPISRNPGFPAPNRPVSGTIPRPR